MAVKHINLQAHNDHVVLLTLLDNVRHAGAGVGKCISCGGPIGDGDKRGLVIDAVEDDASGNLESVILNYICLPCSVESSDVGPAPLVLGAVDE